MQSKLFGTSEAVRGIIKTLCGFLYLAVIGMSTFVLTGWRYVLFTGVGVCIVLFVLAFIFLPKGNLVENEKKENEKKYSFGEILSNKGVWLTTLLILCAYVAWTLGNGYLTTYTTRVLGISQSLASTLGIIRSYIIVVAAGIVGGWFVDKFTYKGKAFICLFACIIAGYMLMFTTHKIVSVCVVITVVLSLLANIMKSTYWSVMGQAGIPIDMTASATGIISFIVFMPDFIIPTIAGSWLDAAEAAGNVEAGFNKIFILVIIFAAVGVAASLLMMKHTKNLEQSGAI